MTLTPEAQALSHASCKHLVTWKGYPEIIIINAAGYVAIRRQATPLEAETVSHFGLLCIR